LGAQNLVPNPSFETSQNDTVLKHFRAININKHKIILQSDITKLADITRQLDENYYSLKKGVYSVADSMALEVNNQKQIIAIIAAYDYAPEFSNDTAYIHEQRKYQPLLNSLGKEYQFISKEKSIKVRKWHDSKTIFELVEIRKKGETIVYSVIFDRELYYKKMNGCFDLNRIDNSIELLKGLGLDD
jgi:hypothetical protein